MSKRNLPRDKVSKENSIRNAENSLSHDSFRRPKDVSFVGDSEQNSCIVNNRNAQKKNSRIVEALSDKTNERDSVLYKNKVKELEEINSKSFDPKMAFSYNFMAGMHSLLKNLEGKLDFKLAAETLDAATKIYASKVEIVHKQTQRISTRFAMTGGEQDKNVGKEKKKKIIKHSDEYTRRNLSKNDSAINGKLQKNLIVDPLYNRLSSAYDVANISVLMSRQMTLMPNGIFALNSSDNLNFSHRDHKIVPSKVEKFPYPLDKPKYVHTVHPALRNFDFHDRSIDMEEMVNRYKFLLQAALERKEQEEEMMNPDDSVCEYIQLSPVPSLDGEEFHTEKIQLNDLELEEDFSALKAANSNEDVQYGQIFAEMSIANSFGGDDCLSNGSPDSDMDEDYTDETESVSAAEKQLNPARKSVKNDVKFGVRNIVRQAEFMMNIFDRKKSGDFLSKKFLKDVFAKINPEIRPKTFHLKETQPSEDESIVTVKKPTVRKVSEPLQLSFKKREAGNLVPNLSQLAIKKRVQRINNLSIRNKFISGKDSFFSSLWEPKISFQLTHNQTNMSATNNPESENEYFDDPLDDHNSFGDGEMNLSLNNSIPFTMPMDTQPLSGATDYCKMPRYVTDFGGNLDPFGLGEQNREFGATTMSPDDLVPIDDKPLDYTTKMKKINIKKLKKIMFNFCEKHKVKKNDFEEYKRENGKEPEDCITFYKLIYYIIYFGNLDERTLDDLTLPIFFVAMLHLCNDKRLYLIKCDDDSGNFYIVFLE